MESRAKLFGHPIHQQLIVFPLGLLGMAVIFDVIDWIAGGPPLAHAAYYMIAAGIITGLLAAVFGLIDWTKIPSGTRGKRIGAWHGGGNLIVVLLYAASWWLRRTSPDNPMMVAYVASLLAVLLALVTGWLGGELVDRLGVGVDDGAHLDAPSSLTSRPATASRDRRHFPQSAYAGVERRQHA